MSFVLGLHVRKWTVLCGFWSIQWNVDWSRLFYYILWLKMHFISVFLYCNLNYHSVKRTDTNSFLTSCNVFYCHQFRPCLTKVTKIITSYTPSRFFYHKIMTGFFPGILKGRKWPFIKRQGEMCSI